MKRLLAMLCPRLRLQPRLLRRLPPVLLPALLCGCALIPDSWLPEDEAPPPQPPPEEFEPLEQASGQVIEPVVARRDIVAPKIDTENFEVGLFTGILDIEDFGADLVYGVRGAYHVTEDFFVEGTYARSTISDTSFRNFGLTLFPAEEEDLTYFNVAVGYNLFPGEYFISKRRAWTSSLFVIMGVGNTDFVNESEFTYSFGFGTRMLPSDYLTLRLDVRDHVFESNLLGQNKLTNNLELTVGLGLLF